MLIENEGDFATLLEKTQAAPLLGLDTETTGLDWKSCEIVGVSTAVDDKEGYFWLGSGKPLAGPIEDPEIEKVFHNSKFDMHFLSKAGTEVAGKIHDTFVLARLLDETRRSRKLNYKLKDLAVEFVSPEAAASMEKLNQWLEQNGLSKGDIGKAPKEILAEYAADDAKITVALYHVLRQKLKEIAIPDSLIDLECEMIRCAYEMEKEGLHIDKAFFEAYKLQLDKEMEPVAAELRTIAGRDFNPGSDDACRDIALELGWVPDANARKLKDDKVSMDKGTLASWDHPFFQALSKYRRISTLRSTFVVGLLERAVERETGWAVHTSFDTMGADTYRWSSKDPNVQNQDKKGESRKGFIPKPGHEFWFFDFKQIEPVIAAHFTGSDKLFKAFADGLDFHTFNAQMAFNVVNPADVTKEQRQAAKVMGLALMYGAGKPKIAKQLGVSYAESSRIVNTFNKNMPEIKKLQRDLNDTILGRAKAEAQRLGRLKPKLGTWYYDDKPIMSKWVNKENTSQNVQLPPGAQPQQPHLWWGPFEDWEAMEEYGWIVNPFGRRLHLQMKQAYRALNRLVQSTAGDCMKIGMARSVKATGTYPVNQVHDELMFQWKAEQVDDLAYKVKTAMESVQEFFRKVPIRVDVAMSTTNWSEEKEVSL